MGILMDRNLPEVIDLFSGCGGLALGFQAAGFTVSHGMDIVPEAVETASYNLHWRHGYSSKHICCDITKTDYFYLLDKIGPNGCIVIGGPPCQAYSLAGRAKLRSLGDDRINTKDQRGFLYQGFLRFAIGLNARAVVMENVPESTDFGGVNVPQTACEILGDHGYSAYWTILNSADFGVPQIRERVFVIAVNNSEHVNIELPEPLFSDVTDRRTNNQKRFNTFSSFANFRLPKIPKEPLPPWVTVGEAISDLPLLFPKCNGKYMPSRMTTPLPYKTPPECEYQKQMRNWYGNAVNSVTGNCFRNTPRDFPIFDQMKQGDDYLAASNIADQLLINSCEKFKISPDTNTDEYERLKKLIVPPYDRTKFTTKWKKLTASEPSHTLVAHLSVDTYSHIHPFEPRGISAREAARLQSFPDDFLFQCSMGDAFKQIGNAVPPLLAKSIALQLMKAFT